MERYDLIVIGSGPAGEKAAVKAAYFRKKVALIEKMDFFGGTKVHVGTPSKTLKETALYYSGRYVKGLYGIERDIQHGATIANFMYRTRKVVEVEQNEVEENLKRHKVDLYKGVASFEDEHIISIDGEKKQSIFGEYIIIATGSYSTVFRQIPVDYKRIHDVSSILGITEFPKSMAILGAGAVGLEYATIFSTIGVQVFLINRSARIMPYIDHSLVAELLQCMQNNQVKLLFNEQIKKVETFETQDQVSVELESGEKFNVDIFLYTAGRNGNVKQLRLNKLAIQTNEREYILVNENYQTAVPHIYAVGDVVGFPSLASTGMDQGRVAVAHIFKTRDIEQINPIFPYAIYTIPDISTVGLSEEEAKKKGLDYCVGIARHENMARGMIMGVKIGLLKLIFTKTDLIIRGVHIIGPLAAELIHYGMALIESKNTLYDVIGKIYNTPTLHELYKYAAYDGLGNLAGYKIKP